MHDPQSRPEPLHGAVPRPHADDDPRGEDFDDWLTRSVGKEVLQPAPENVLRGWMMSERVNKAPKLDKPDDATLIDPL